MPHFHGALSMDQRLTRLERILTPRNARLTLLLIAALSLFFAAQLPNVRLDHDFERFFPTDDPELDRYMAFRERFGNDNDLLLVAAPHHPTIYDTVFLRRMDTLAGQLGRIPDVLSVHTPTRMSEPRVTPLGVFQVPWLRTGTAGELAADSARIHEHGELIGSFISADGGALLILLQTLPDLSKRRSDALLERVEELVRESGVTDVELAGRVHGQYWYIEKMKEELVLFFTVSVLLLALFLAVANRTLWGVLVPIGVVGLTVLWQVGLITLLGLPLTILTMLVPTIIFVVGMSDVVHILERYIEALRNGHPKARALAVAYREVGLATFLTSLTTSIGFATLLTSGIGPIREFGVLNAIGVQLAFCLAFTLLPATLLLVPTPLQARRAEQQSIWHPVLARTFRFVLRNRRWLPMAFAALTAVSAYGITRLKVDNQLLEDWSEEDPQKQAYYWFEEHFGGARPFEMEVSMYAPNASVWDLPHLRAMERVEQHLREHHGIGAIVSPVAVVKAVNKALNGGQLEYNRLPEDEQEMRRVLRHVERLGAQRTRVATDDARTARISGRMRDEGGYLHRIRDQEMRSFISAHTDRSVIEFRQTGMAYLIDRNNERLSSQMIGGLSIAFLLISLIMAGVFRNWRMTMIALIPNVIPLLWVGGMMAVAGIDIKVSTAIIFTIAFGIAVDDTIHLLGKLRVELQKGKTLPYAMKRAFFSAGKALILTTILLLSGFAPLVVSDLASVYYMGLLVGLTLFMALLADLLLLPILVLKWLPVRRS